jgi:hypothetical protein
VVPADGWPFTGHRRCGGRSSCAVMLLVVLAYRPAMYWSDRVGRHNCTFKMPKFRSMRVGALRRWLPAYQMTRTSAHRFFLRKAAWTTSGLGILVGGMIWVLWVPDGALAWT